MVKHEERDNVLSRTPPIPPCDCQNTALPHDGLDAAGAPRAEAAILLVAAGAAVAALPPPLLPPAPCTAPTS